MRQTQGEHSHGWAHQCPVSTVDCHVVTQPILTLEAFRVVVKGEELGFEPQFCCTVPHGTVQRRPLWVCPGQ